MSAGEVPGGLPIDAALIGELAGMRRESASPGTRRAAATIAARLAELGLEPRLERESMHGTYWVPLGLLEGAAALASVLPRRLALPVAGLAALGVADELWIGRRRPLRRLLPRREGTNVVATLGPADAAETVVVQAHHDAAHSGLVFHPALPRALSRIPGLRRRRTTVPALWGALVGPLLTTLGALAGKPRARRLGGLASVAFLPTLADIARAPVVPGACDNLSGVGALLALARELAREPPACRVVLLSTDGEESFLEGMACFLRRHADELDPRTTTFLCLESVGAAHLVLLDGEGMAKLHRYPPEPRATLGRTAARLGIPLEPGFRFRFATDGQLPLLAGHPTAVIASVDWYRTPRNYHWPSDDADHVDLTTAGRAARLALAYLRSR
jgi:hypothetical protein